MMNFLRYDPDTGNITGKGFMDPAVLNQLISSGEPILKNEDAARIDTQISRIDLETKGIIARTLEDHPQQQTLSAPGLTFLQFMNLFTKSEKENILSSNDPDVRLFVISLSGGMFVNISSPDVKTGLSHLVAMNVIDDVRMAEILSQKQPS